MGQKSRAKRLARQQNAAPKEHARTRGRRNGFSRREQWLLLVALAVVVIGLGAMTKSVLTSTATSSAPTSNMPSMNDSSGGQGIAVGKRVAMADMAMPASSGKQVALGKYRGKKLVVYFYEGVT
jgi:hypothetical protein